MSHIQLSEEQKKNLDGFESEYKLLVEKYGLVHNTCSCCGLWIEEIKPGGMCVRELD